MTEPGPSPGVAFDHAPIIVRDLDAACARYRQLGFNPTPRCRHTARATANHLIVFDGCFTEVVGLLDPAERDPVLDDLLRAREGMSLIALRSHDAAADRERLIHAGLAVSDVLTLERPVDFPGHRGVARFRLVMIETPEHPFVQLFLTEHMTPQIVWIPEYMEHPNGARAITGITIVADAPKTLAPLLTAALDRAPVQEGGGLRWAADNCEIDVLTAAQAAARFPGFAPEATRPYVAGQRVNVSDLGRAIACLEAGDIPYRTDGNNRVWLAPDETRGVLIEFAGHNPSSHRGIVT